MPRFFVERENISENKITITNTDVAHITRVLRMNVGEPLTICDGMGNDYETKISQISEKSIDCDIIS